MAINGVWVGWLTSVFGPKLFEVIVAWTGWTTPWSKAKGRREQDNLLSIVRSAIDAALTQDRDDHRAEMTKEQQATTAGQHALAEQQMDLQKDREALVAATRELHRREAVVGARERAADGRERAFKDELERTWKHGYESALDTLW
jgi:hypothetical protein